MHKFIICWDVGGLQKESEHLKDVKKQLEIEKHRRMDCEHEINTLKQKLQLIIQLHEEVYYSAL